MDLRFNRKTLIYIHLLIPVIFFLTIMKQNISKIIAEVSYTAMLYCMSFTVALNMAIVHESLNINRSGWSYVLA